MHDTRPNSIRVLLWLGLAGQLVAYLSISRAVDLDVFHQMALFREALATGAVPRGDVFAYAGTLDTVVHHEWGMGAILYGVWQATGWGPAGVGALQYLLVAAVAALAYRAARSRGATGAAIAIVAPIAIFLVIVAFMSPVRAQAFTILFTVALFVLLEFDRTGARWWIPLWLVAHVAWLNIHGGFVVGFAVVGGAALERFIHASSAGTRPRAAFRGVAHLGAVLVAMALLVAMNPYGWDYVPYLWRALRMHRPSIVEWAPLWDGRVDRALLLGYLLSLLVAAYAVWRAGLRRAMAVNGWAFLALAAGAAMLSTRHLSLYSLAWFTWTAPLLSSTALGRLVLDAWRRRPAGFAVLAAALVALGAWSAGAKGAWAVTVPSRPDGGEPRWYPVGAVEYLARARFTGRLLTRFQDGAYVSWMLHPAVKVSFDSRYEAAYVPGTFERHMRLFDASPGWRAILDVDAADAILVPRATPLEAALDASGTGWVLVHRDASDSIYAREGISAALPRSDHAAKHAR